MAYLMSITKIFVVDNCRIECFTIRRRNSIEADYCDDLRDCLSVCPVVGLSKRYFPDNQSINQFLRRAQCRKANRRRVINEHAVLNN